MSPKQFTYTLLGLIYAVLLILDWDDTLILTVVLTFALVGIAAILYLTRSLEVGEWITWREFKRRYWG